MTTTQTSFLTQDADHIHWAELVAEGIDARRKRDGTGWQLGDLALEVETTYGGNELERYAEEIGVSFGTLTNYRTVAVAYENCTRVQNLSFKHHRVVAARPDRLEWLARAEADGWSVAHMLEVIETEEAERKAAIADEEARIREEAIAAAELKRLRALSEEWVARVESGEISIAQAMAEAIRQEERRKRDEEDRKTRVKVASTTFSSAIRFLADQLSDFESPPAILSMYDPSFTAYVVDLDGLILARKNLDRIIDGWPRSER